MPELDPINEPHAVCGETQATSEAYRRGYKTGFNKGRRLVVDNVDTSGQPTGQFDPSAVNWDRVAKEALTAAVVENTAQLRNIVELLDTIAGVMASYAAHHHINPYPAKVGNGKYAL